jgi:murein DD-endopeptidase MepM/ murein hydrolase activator NlpD
MPIAGLSPADLRESFDEVHSGHRHEAIDILAPRGTPVRAVADGTIRKLFHSVPGGITVYEFDRGETVCYYYAHLDRYAEGLAEGQRVRAGDTIGYVGTSGNAPPGTPHLHFAVSRLGPEKRWWQGTPIDPYPLLLKARPAPPS